MSWLPHEPVDGMPADRARVLLVGEPGPFGGCLGYALAGCGLDFVFHPVAYPVDRTLAKPDLALFCIGRLDPDLGSHMQRRIGELHGIHPGLRMMILSEDADRGELRQTAHPGIGTIVAGIGSAELLASAVRYALSGDATRQSGGEAATSHGRTPEPSPLGSLPGNFDALLFTERELTVLARLRRGLPNKVIAHELGLSESTIKVHLRSIMAKLNVTNRTQVVSALAGHTAAQASSPHRGAWKITVKSYVCKAANLPD